MVWIHLLVCLLCLAFFLFRSSLWGLLLVSVCFCCCSWLLFRFVSLSLLVYVCLCCYLWSVRFVLFLIMESLWRPRMEAAHSFLSLLFLPVLVPCCCFCSVRLSCCSFFVALRSFVSVFCCLLALLCVLYLFCGGCAWGVLCFV